MNIRFSPFPLHLRRPFSIAHGSRSTTPAVLVEIESRGITGYGEASLPPYLGETESSVTGFLRLIQISEEVTELSLPAILERVDRLLPGHRAAKAAVDIALHDWVGKSGEFAWYERWGLDPASIRPGSGTIGFGTRGEIREKIREAEGFQFLKVKLGTDHDREIVTAVREYSDRTIRVDVNEGWGDRSGALKMIEWLEGQNTELVEQPLPRMQIDDIRWLKERSPLPIIADEAVSVVEDLEEIGELYDGVNVKLMKCGGMAQALRMIHEAKSLGLRVMIGCMTETSCGISAATQLAPLADWVDLDGALLIDNDPFVGATMKDGRMVPGEGPGIGVRKRLNRDL